ncbi:hypothetical protein FRC17_004200 [Serendipita sp. 399]|nr:hypothetical protein FRC17_004200 [Serendipita sp. 399]
MDYLSRAPRRQSIPLPSETFPFALRASLAAETTFLSLCLSLPSIHCPNLTADEFSRPATNPSSNIMRVVHPCLSDSVIIVRPSAANSTTITVGDVLQAIHAHLAAPISPGNIPPNRRADVISYYQSQSPAHSPSSLKRVHLLEGATIFAGLFMDIGQSNRILGQIDELQSRTWILATREQQLPHIRYQFYSDPATGAPSSSSRAQHPSPHTVDEMGHRVGEQSSSAARYYPTPPFSSGGR